MPRVINYPEVTVVGPDMKLGLHSGDALTMDWSGMVGDGATEATMSQRLCVLAEVRLYFDNIENLDKPKPNLNCNPRNWSGACEAGFSAQKLTPGGLDSEVVPVRTSFKMPCCDGFFCPRGLTCMIRKFTSIVSALGTHLGFSKSIPFKRIDHCKNVNSIIAKILILYFTTARS